MNIVILIFVVVVFVIVMMAKFRFHSAVLRELGELTPEHREVWLENKKAPKRNLIGFVLLMGVVFLIALSANSNGQALLALPVIGWLAATFSWLDRRRILQVLHKSNLSAAFSEAVKRLKTFEWGVLAMLAVVWSGFAFASISAVPNT